MSSPPQWADRRGIFQSGKAVHEPARRRSSASTSSDEASKAAKPGGLASLLAQTGAGPAPEGSTKFIYRRGREVHEGASAGRKKSVSGGGAEGGEGAKVVGGTEAPGVAGRRRSSASSQGGSFSAVLSNPDYAQRRQSWDDMKAPGGFGGIFGNLMGRSAEKK